jgi:hypothetical protein
MRASGAPALGLALWLLASAAPAGDDAESLTLAELMRGMASATGVAAEFAERKEIALLSEPLESRGRLYFVPPDRLARFTTFPDFSALVVDGAQVRFRDGSGGEEVDLSASPLARVFVDNFVVLFSGDLERLERIYAPELHAEGHRWILSLTPRHPPLDGVIDRIVLEGEGRSIARMEVREQDGDRTLTVFDAVVTDAAFAPPDLERLFREGSPLSDSARGR